MADSLGVDNQLRAGYFTTSRPKSPKPRANQSSKLDPHVPRSFPGLPRRYPPPPSVEDEAESLAKEYGGSVHRDLCNEEPKFRGDVEQQPILLPVPEFNPERRFVILTKSADTDDEGHDGTRFPDEGKPGRGKSEYQANTCRKFTIPRIDEESSPKQPEVKRRKSHLNLPRIATDLELNESPGSLHRSRSATRVEQQPRDYFDRQDHQRSPGDGFLSPSFIKHSTKGRDRAYWDFSRDSNQGDGGTGARARSNDLRLTSDDRRSSTRCDRSTLSASPVAHRRASSAVDMPKSPRRTSEKYRYQEEVSSSRANRKNVSPPLRDRKNSSPPQLERQRSSPPRDREKLVRRGSTYKKDRDSPPRVDGGYSSDEQSKSSRRSHRDRRKSIINQEDRNGLLSPDAARPSVTRSKSQTTTPLPSPRLPQSRFQDPEPTPSSRASASFIPPKERRRLDERPVSPFSSGSSSPRSRSRIREEEKPKGPRPSAPAKSINTPVSAGPSMVLPIPIPISTSVVSDGRRSQMPPTPTSRQNSLESSPPKNFWQPPPFNPSQNGSSLEKPIQSYRRYSEDVSQGVTPDLPYCPRQTPKAGYNDWLTFPRCDNFNVCPDCYNAVFANTEHRTELMPMPFRPRDKKIDCDLGSSHWYRIAWLMTKKYQFRDLRLLKGIADASSKYPPCTGGRRSSRAWHSVRDPYSYKPLPDFNVCSGCAKSVEVLFPNLVSIFQPTDLQADVTKGICAMHFFPERRRFLNYFDLLESTSDNALYSKSSPNIEYLVDRIRRISRTEECTRDELVDNKDWYNMESMRDFTVCEECFNEVVFPQVEKNNAIARKFYKKPQLRERGTCQLYSPRMREIFLQACRGNDLDYLEAKVRERREMHARIQKRLHRFEDGKASEVNEEAIARLVAEWKRWE